MAKFTFDTLQEESTSYHGPSGTVYIMYRGTPFSCSNEQDTKFFDKNPRFTRVGRRAKAKHEPSAEVKLQAELESITGINKKLAEKLADQFVTRKELQDHLDNGLKIIGLTDRQFKKVFDAFATRRE